MSRRSIALVLFAAACGGSNRPSVSPPAASSAGGRVWPDEGPATWAPRPTETAITANDLRTRLYGFADDSMLGRRIGEPGNYKGTSYIASEFKRLGLKPAGDNGTFFQTLPFGPSGFDINSSKLIAAGKSLAPRTDWVPVAPTAANGLGASANLDNVQTVYAGRFGDTTTLDPAAFRGKVAVFTATPAQAGLTAGGRAAQPVLRCDSVPNKFGAEAAARVEAQQRADSASRAGVGGRGGRGGGAGGGARDTRAQRAGAAGILFVALVDTTGRGAFNSRMGMQFMPAAGSLPAAAITRPAAEGLFGRAIDQLTVGTPGQSISAQWNYTFRVSDTPARNVVAILPGSDPARAGEYVLVGAHNDHVGVNTTVVDHDSLRAVNMVTRRQGANDPVCRPTDEQWKQINSMIAHARSIRPPRRDSIMNGADDDGSGTVILLEVAERFAAEKPARSIIFVSHQGEEAGLLGSRWFTDHPTIQLEQVVAALNMDMEAKGRADQVINGGPNSIQTLGSRRLSREFGDIIDSVAANGEVKIAIDRTWDVPANPMNRFCRSDQVNYVRHNVPVTYFSTGYAYDYHQQTDEPRYADYDHMAKIGHFIHDIMWTIANRKDRPAITGADPNYPSCGR
ncbi:MAG TPA: M28 family peptidase [Gemmatimonadaceae bacterium]|nr:M28 family peptidase [Gemmatimonadaceae bacterium]